MRLSLLLFVAVLACVASSARAATPLYFSHDPQLQMSDGYVRVGGLTPFRVSWGIRDASVGMSETERAQFEFPLVRVRLWEYDGHPLTRSDLLGTYSIPVQLHRFQEGEYVVRRLAQPRFTGYLSAFAGPWPRAITGASGTDPDPDLLQYVYVEVVGLVDALSPGLFIPAAGETLSVPFTPYHTAEMTGLSESTRAETQFDTSMVELEFITNDKDEPVAQAEIPLLVDQPGVSVVGATSETLADVFLDTSGATPTLLLESDDCSRRLRVTLEIEHDDAVGDDGMVTIQMDTANATLQDMDGAPVEIQPGLAFAFQAYMPADEAASFDTSLVAATPAFGAAGVIGQVEGAPGAVMLNNDGMMLSPRLGVEMYASPPMGLIDPEILGAGWGFLNPDGSFTVDLFGDGNGFPANARLRLRVLGEDGGDAITTIALGPACGFDFDRNGEVDSFDLSQLLAQWGTCP